MHLTVELRSEQRSDVSSFGILGKDEGRSTKDFHPGKGWAREAAASSQHHNGRRGRWTYRSLFTGAASGFLTLSPAKLHSTAR